VACRIVGFPIPDLHRVQPMIESAVCKQRIVSPSLHDATAIQHENQIGVDDRRQPVSDHEHRSTRQQTIDRFLDEAL
jgi:hypothetical protein